MMHDDEVRATAVQAAAAILGESAYSLNYASPANEFPAQYVMRPTHNLVDLVDLLQHYISEGIWLKLPKP